MTCGMGPAARSPAVLLRYCCVDALQPVVERRL